jgi:hypothetical protein
MTPKTMPGDARTSTVMSLLPTPLPMSMNGEDADRRRRTSVTAIGSAWIGC